MTRYIEVRPKAPALGIERTIEEQLLDAVLIVEILDMAHVGHAHAHMGV